MTVDVAFNFGDVMWRKFIEPVVSVAWKVALLAVVALLLVFLYYTLRNRLNPFHLSRDRLVAMRVRLKLVDFIRWKLVDTLDAAGKAREFEEYGLTVYCGKQGAGKTIAMVEYLRRMKERYPACLIVTNFACELADMNMGSWQDFFDIRNGTDGVIFALDEIHSEYSSASWKDFPESLLSEISMQRKQRIKIVATAQVFGRMVKPLREQSFSVMLCSTYFKRWTFCREYDAWEYEAFSGGVPGGKLKSFWRFSFVQQDSLRESYDTYEKIKRLAKTPFIPRHERGNAD
jgi:ATP-dependent Clp protease ATP-binding subunit ClpX